MTSLNKVFLLLLIVSLGHGRTPSLRLCGDLKCGTIISTARTVINYQPSEVNHVSFRGNTPCRVMSKSIGDNSDLWEIEVQGRRGYAPKKMIMEQKILIKAADLVQIGNADEPGSGAEKLAENTTFNVESTSVNAEPQNVVKADEQVSNNKLEPILDADVKLEDKRIENDQKEKEENDDDDNDEQGYLDQVPVNEPLAIKRDMYKTGDGREQKMNNENMDIHLEVVGLNNNDENAKKLEVEINEGGDIKRPEKIENHHKENIDVTEETSEENIDVTEETSEENINVSEDNASPAVTYQEQLNSQNSLNDQLPKENVTSEDLPKIEEHQNNVEQYKDEIITKSNEMENSVHVNEVESTEPVADPIIMFNSSSEITDNKESESFEDNGSLNILSSTTLSGESSSIYTDNIIPNTDNIMLNTVNTPEPVETETIKEEQLDIHKQENEKTSEHLANGSNNEDPIQNDLIIQMQKDFIENDAENVDEYYTAEASDTNIPEAFVAPEQIQEAADMNNEEHTAVPTMQNIVEQKPEIIENQANPHEPIYDSDSKLPSTSPYQFSENDVKTNDIFSSHFQPESQPEIASENEETNWYDGILIFVEDTITSVKNIFDKKESENGDREHSVESVFDENGYCENLQGENCPKNQPKVIPANHLDNISKIKDFSNSKLVDDFLAQIVARADLVVLLLLTASSILIFIFGHYCLVNHRRESTLIAQLNSLERKLILSQKECSVAKADLTETSRKLNSIANKSFGADDMIKQYEVEKNALCEQIASLERELETAAEAGLELNKMVQELLSNQSGSDSIINSVEELQHQLNEQEANMIYINNLLAEKSRENSELQVLLSDTNQRFGAEIQELLTLNKQLEADKTAIETQQNEKMHSLEAELKENAEMRSNEVFDLKGKYNELKAKHDEIISNWRTSAARAEALEETIKKMETFNGKDDIKSIIEATDANAKCIALKKENESLGDRLDSEIECKNRLQEQIKELNDDITRLRAEFNQHEKDKLEAETRLEVLSNYFKEKESQLQKELNIKEELFMKQQGESSTTINRIRSSQEDIQKLRSQNDELRAEIEAQSAAHKAQINAAEVRAHDSWLAAKQGERRLEEARSEASILRKKLTSLTSFGGTTSENNFNRNLIDGFIPDLNAPSPIHLESPSSPVLPPLNLPPPPLIPAPMYSGMTPFMPPPPLPLPNEMRPTPLGRLMSPPPPDHRFVANFVEPSRYENNRYSPDDYPPDLYETETDFSPPRSPPRSPEFYRGRSYRNYSPEVPIKKKSNRKGTLSSESVESRDRI